MLIRVAMNVAAPVEQVYSVYADYRRWPEFFPTIHGVRLVGHDQDGSKATSTSREPAACSRPSSAPMHAD